MGRIHEHLRPVSEESIEGKGSLFVYAMVPSLLTEEALMRMRAPELVAQGYSLALKGKGLTEFTKRIYGRRNSLSYFALSEGKAVGSVTHQLLIRKEADIVANTFWNKIGRFDAALLRKAEESAVTDQLFAAYGAGVVTLPEWRKSGIQKRLITRFIHELHPSIFVAETRSPEAAALVSSVYGEYGYRTFLGNTEITKEKPSRAQTPTALLKAHLYLVGKPETSGLALSFPRDVMASTLPQVGSFSSSLQHAFEPLMEAQIADRNSTFYLPLISVKKELLF